MIINKFLNPLTFNTLSGCRKYVVVASNYPIFYAVKKKEEKTLYIHYDKYIFKKNDQIIDENDMSYYVKEVDSKFEYKEGEHNYIVQKITYEEQPLSLPSYIELKANNSINIDASGASFNAMNVSAEISQQLSYTQILTDLNNVINNCYHIKDYKEMMKIIQSYVDDKKPIEESKIKKFFKFMGTQVQHLVEVFLVAYATALANKLP